jgi:hypothetical protein
VNHIFYYRISDYVEHRHVKVWYFRWVPTPLFRRIERLFGWHLCVTAEVLGKLPASSTMSQLVT